MQKKELFRVVTKKLYDKNKNLSFIKRDFETKKVLKQMNEFIMSKYKKMELNGINEMRKDLAESYDGSLI